MITSHFISRLITRFASVSCLFILTATLYAQNATPAAKPSPAAKPATAAKPTTAAAANQTAAPAASKPLSFRFREIEKDSNVDKMRTQLATYINKGQFENPEDDKDALIQYYKDYFFGRWVNYGRFYQMETYPETLRKQARMSRKPKEKKSLEEAATRWNYPAFINDFRKDLDRSKSNGDPQKMAVKLAYDFAVEVIESNNAQCTPAVKYNCALLLGNLYYKITSSDLPVVYPPAIEMLNKLVSGTKTPRYLKIGALVSLNKLLAETNLTEKQKSDIYVTLIEVVKTKIDPATFASSPDDPSGEGAYWSKDLAIEGIRILADFNQRVDKAQGFYPGKEALGAIFQTINDKKAPMATRIAAMESLGSYNFGKYSDLKATAGKLQTAVANLVIDAIQVELDRKVDNLVWGDDLETQNRQNVNEEGAEPTVDNTNNAIFLLQRAMPAIYSAKVALEGVNSSKGWSGLSKFGSSNDNERAAQMIAAIKNFTTEIKNLSKDLTPSSEGGSTGEFENDDYDPTDNLQSVITALKNFQDNFRQIAE